MLIHLKPKNFNRVQIYLFIIIWLYFVDFDQKVKCQIQAYKIDGKWQVWVSFTGPDHGGVAGRDLARGLSVTLVERGFGPDDVTGVFGKYLAD